MIYQKLRSALLLGLGLVILTPFAAAAKPVDKVVVEKLRAALEIPAMGLKVGSVEVSEIPGLLAVQFTDGPMVYATPAGDYFILGDLFSIKPDRFVNLAERRRDGERLQKLAKVAPQDMITFSPQGTPKTHITVFTDVTCFYCQKLHNEVPELNKRGVEVRYLAYPRAGVDSDGYRKLVSAWCAANPREALTRLKNKEAVPDNVCAGNPVAAQYQLGQDLGVRGTPALITESGELISGYQPADELMKTLNLQ